MATGKVKWFNRVKGYGFIEQESGGPDLFVHTSNVQGDPIKDEDDVEYEVGEGPKGPSALNVRLTGSASTQSPEAEAEEAPAEAEATDSDESNA